MLKPIQYSTPISTGKKALCELCGKECSLFLPEVLRACSLNQPLLNSPLLQFILVCQQFVNWPASVAKFDFLCWFVSVLSTRHNCKI